MLFPPWGTEGDKGILSDLSNKRKRPVPFWVRAFLRLGVVGNRSGWMIYWAARRDCFRNCFRRMCCRFLMRVSAAAPNQSFLLLPDPLVPESVLPELLIAQARDAEPVFPPMIPPNPPAADSVAAGHGAALLQAGWASANLNRLVLGRIVDELPLVVVILLFVEQDGLLGAAGGEADDAPSAKGLSADSRRGTS
jgi:hypothetical protein